MRQMKVWLIVLLFPACLLGGCGDSSSGKPATTVTASFESGSIGKTDRKSDTQWDLYIADDNNNPALPASWRSWWYVRMDNLVTDAPTSITLKNSGWPYYYIPVYSYDHKNWIRFDESEVTQNSSSELVVSKKYGQTTVWIAMFYPYTFTDLKNYVNSLKGNPYVDISIPGHSQQGRPLYLFKVTDSTVPASAKKRIFMHARTHPAETPPSFLIEGLLRFLLSGTPKAAELLAGFEFYIFPMQNVDGVVAGNYRSTPKSENLEMSWVFDATNPLELTGAVLPEVSVIHQYAKTLMTGGGPPVSIALNLHASNSEPDVRAFFYPHFGPASLGYSLDQELLWNRQLHFIDGMALRYGADMFEPVPADGGGSFAGKTYPESWWWANFSNTVMAMTIEMTYGRAGYAPRWIEPDDLRNLGGALALGIQDYFTQPLTAAKSTTKTTATSATRVLKYPALYPPSAPDEMKE
jgi:hypothetical protein